MNSGMDFTGGNDPNQGNQNQGKMTKWHGSQMNARETSFFVNKHGPGTMGPGIHARDKSYGLSDGRHGEDPHSITHTPGVDVMRLTAGMGVGALQHRTGHHGGGIARVRHANAQAELGPPPQVGESTSGQDRIEGAPNES